MIVLHSVYTGYMLHVIVTMLSLPCYGPCLYCLTIVFTMSIAIVTRHTQKRAERYPYGKAHKHCNDSYHLQMNSGELNNNGDKG